ncbi:mannitol-1-phosphate 5-dehydrogenase [Microbacterium sp. 8M]|uniref:mannitol-1-phosphate 5-dehydrogenase n=1 Tax=Microbacterium sp. 8M TaxID=2653153 RepID=UPI0012F0D04E|nr:mannitol-1-phosphate 5-dehydrogenase [Microbacterium sp. 8M]VXB17152.1 mannitol-1-phosphate 5-dehydrogenase [Microbacterium sp. 8M]
MPVAVHFGAGNIGRGFVGLLLHEGGYDLVFSDVAADLVNAINAAPEYTVHEAGPGGADHVVTGYRAVDSRTDPEAAAAAVATADVVTTAVGPTVLRFVAPTIVAGLRLRDPDLPPLQVMACENAIGATDLLRTEIAAAAGDDSALLARAVFANTAVDRIVPAQAPGQGVDVTVEPYFEWAIESGPFGDRPPHIPGAHFVDDLAPYIERKLFTVNTGHAATAYFGERAGAITIAEALQDPATAAAVEAALEETSNVLSAVHGLDPEELSRYRAKILDRFRNPLLPDTVRRVGRQPLRKLSRHERFIGPAAMAAERGLGTSALVAAVGAALSFDAPEDEESVRLQELLRALDADAFTVEVTGLDAAHPLYAPVRDEVARHQDR